MQHTLRKLSCGAPQQKEKAALHMDDLKSAYRVQRDFLSLAGLRAVSVDSVVCLWQSSSGGLWMAARGYVAYENELCIESPSA